MARAILTLGLPGRPGRLAHIEALEDWIAPAFTSVAGPPGTLTLEGTAGDDIAAFSLQNPSTLLITHTSPAGAPQTFDLTGVTSIVARGLAGSDWITLNLANGAIATAGRTFGFEGGGGASDILRFQGAGSEAALWTPGAANAGSVSIGGGSHAYAAATGGLGFTTFASVTLQTPAGADNYTLTSSQLGSTAAAQKAALVQIGAIAANLGMSDAAGGAADLLTVTGLPAGTSTFNFSFGEGSDQLIFNGVDSLSGVNLTANGGGNTGDILRFTSDQNMTLADSGLTLASGTLALNGTFPQASLTGGASANTFNISNWTGTGTLTGLDGVDKLIQAGENFISYGLNNSGLTRLATGSVQKNFTLSSVEQSEITAWSGDGALTIINGFTGSVVYNALGVGDTLVHNYAGAVPTGGTITFNGAGVGDRIWFFGNNTGTATWNPSGATAATGTLTYGGSTTTYNNAGGGVSAIGGFAAFVAQPGAGASAYTLDGNTLRGTSPAQRATFTGVVGAVTIDLGINDTVAAADSLTVSALPTFATSVSADAGLGTDTLGVTADVDLTLTNASLTFAGAGTPNTLAPNNSFEVANLTGGGAANTFTISGWTGGGSLTGGGGTDTVASTNDVDFTLGNAQLRRGNLGVFQLDSIESATLTGGAGDNAFTVTDWTGTGTLTGLGGTNTVRATNNVTLFTLSDAQLQRAGHGNLGLANIQAAHLTGSSTANTFDVSGWTGAGSLTGLGGTDILTATNDLALFGLSDTQLTRTGFGTLTLDTIETANLSGGGSANTFDISGWTGTGALTGFAGTDKLIQAGESFNSYTLNDGGLTRLGAGSVQKNFTLSSVEQAEITAQTAAGSLTITSGSPGFNGSVVYNGLGGNDTLIHSYSGGLPAGGAITFNGSGGTDKISFFGSGSGTATWTPNGTIGGAGTIAYGGSSTTYTNAPGGLNVVSGLGGFTVRPGAGASAYTLNGNTLSSTSPAHLAKLTGSVGALTIDLGANDAGAAADSLTISALPGFASSLSVLTGQGDDAVLFGTAVFFSPVSLNGGPGSDTFSFSADSDFTLTDASLAFANGGTPYTLALNNSFEQASLTGGASSNTFTVSGWSGSGTLHGGSAGFDTVSATNDVDFVLTDSLLTRQGPPVTTFGLTSIESARLTGGASANRFEMSGWTGNAALTGGGNQDTIIAENDVAGFTLTDTQLARTGRNTVSFMSIEAAELSGGAGPNAFTVSGWTGTGTLSGGGDLDTVVAVNDLADFGLSDSLLTRTGLGALALSAVEVANLTGGAGQNTFTVSDWSGTGTLTGGGEVDTVVAINDIANFGLSDTQLNRTGFGTLTLDAIEVARLTGGASANAFTLSSFTGDATLSGLEGADTLNLTAVEALQLTATSANAAMISYAGTKIDVTEVEDFQLHGAGLSLTGSSAVPGTHDDEVIWEPNVVGLNPSALTILNGGVIRTVSFDGSLTSAAELKKLTLTTFAGADDLTLSADGNGVGTISNSVASGAYTTAFENVDSFVLALGEKDVDARPDAVTVRSLSAIAALQSLEIQTGAGGDTITLESTVATLNRAVAGGAFTIDAGEDFDTVNVTADTALTLTNSATVNRLVYGDHSELTYAGLEIFNLTVDSLTFSGSDAETLYWTPRDFQGEDHEGSFTVNNPGLPTRTIFYDLDFPATAADFPLAFRHLSKLTLEPGAGASDLTLAATSEPGVASLSGANVIFGNLSVAVGATLSTIETIVLDLGNPLSGPAADKLTIRSLEIEGANSLTFNGGDGDDLLELSSDLTTTRLGLPNATPSGGLVFNAGEGIADKIKAARAPNAGSIELTDATVAYGATRAPTTPAAYADVELFEMAADAVNYTGSGMGTVTVTPSGTVASSGTALLGGSRSLNYTGKLGIFNAKDLFVITPKGFDSFDLGGFNLIGSLSGQVAGATAQAIDFSNVSNVTLDLGGSDIVDPAIDSLRISSLSAAGLKNLTVITGSGDDTLALEANVTSLLLPIAGGSFKFNAGTGDDTIMASADVSMVLGQISASQAGLIYQDNTPNHGALGQIEFVGDAVDRAELTGGAGDNRFVVKAWAGPVRIFGGSGADLFDVTGALIGGTGRDPGVLDGGPGDDTFLIQASNGAMVASLLGPTSVNGGSGLDTIVASGDLNFVLTDTAFTRTVPATKTTAASTVTIDVSALEKADLTGGVRANLLDAGQFSGTAKLIGKGGIDNLVAGKQGGELFGFEVSQPTPQQLKNKPFAATYTRDNFFVADGTVDGATTSILATTRIGSLISFRYFQSTDAALGIQYTLQLNKSSNTQQVARAAGQHLNVTMGIDGVPSGPIDLLEGSSFNDRLTGSKRPNILAGLRGNDLLTAVGVDYRFGGPGADLFAGPPSFAFQDRTFPIPGVDGASKTKVRPAYTTVSTPFARPAPELIDRIAEITA